MNQETRELLFSFFLNFSRLEYALKSDVSFSTGNGSNDPFRVDWGNFIKWLKVEQPSQPSSLNDAMAYLRKHPPKKQVSVNSFDNDWSNKSEFEDWSSFCVKCLKTVRNNLFHGGKIPFDFERDTRLLQSCNEIIFELVSLCPPSVRNKFKESNLG